MIRGYPEEPALLAGDQLRLHVSTEAPRFRVRFFRCGARVQEMSCEAPWLAGEFEPAGEAGIPWQWPAYSFEVPLSWRSGAYIAVLETEAGGEHPAVDARSARALFAVRSARSNPPLLVVLPLFTYHAYNVAHFDATREQGEGDCLYSGAPWVSLHRPGGGVGGHPWDEVNVDVYDTQSPRQTFAHWDAKALAWLEANRYDFDCVTDIELHDLRFDLHKYRAIVSFGHHEYWTQQMRDRVDAYLSVGGNVAFFGGNTCWFRAEYDAERRAVRRAGRWSEQPEWKTTGVSYAYGGGKWIGPRPSTDYTVEDATHWIFEGTGLSNGQGFGGADRLIGYECDGASPESDLYILAKASIHDWSIADGSGEVSDAARATLGIREDHGFIFTASTVDWARVLECNPVVQQITNNVLRRPK